MLKNWTSVFLLLLMVGLGACSALPEELANHPAVAQQEKANYLLLTPKDNTLQKQTGILFYPGGLVAPQAYVQPLQELAAAGYPVVIVKVTGNLAIFNVGKAAQFRNLVAVDQWVIGGHSLGGVIASYDVRDQPQAYAGLFLWASFSGEAADLSNWQGAALSLSAEQDGLTLAEDVEQNKAYLPSPVMVQNVAAFPSTSTTGTTIYHEIQGGNHAQFGSYGTQNGDGEASISKGQQHSEIIAFMQAFLQANQW